MSGTNVGAAVTSGFVELGGGCYEWTGSIIDGQQGCVVFSASGVVKAVAALNAAESENADSRTSAVPASVWTVPTRTLTAFAFTVDILQSAADKVWTSASRTLTAFSTALGQAVWDVLAASVSAASSIGLQVKTNVDAATSTRLAAVSYTAPDNATIGSAALELTEVHGLLGQNSGLRNTVYSGGGLASYSLFLYDSLLHAQTNDGATGVLHRYDVTNTFDGSGNLLTSSVARVS